MNALTPAWRECLVCCGLALLAALAALLMPAEAKLSLHGWPALVKELPRELVITRSHAEAFKLDRSAEPAVLRDADGRILGVADPQAIEELYTVLRECRIMHRQPVAELPPETLTQWGFDRAVRLQLGDESLLFASAGTDRGYCRRGETILILSQDPAALLDRPPSRYRPAGLAMPHYLHGIRHDDGWRLDIEDRRWWLQLRDGGRRWPDDERLMAWLRELVNVPIAGFLTHAPGGSDRVGLRCLGRSLDGDERVVDLADLGPTDDGEGRLLRRSQHLHGQLVHEWYRIASDGAVLDPDPRSFLGDGLLPVSPLRADEVVFGPLVLQRREDLWLLNGSTDADQPQIRQLLTRLASLPRLDVEPPASSDGGLGLRLGEHRFTLPYRDPRLQEVLDELQIFHFRDRHLLPGVGRREIVGVVFAAAGATPQIFQRQADGQWLAADAAELNAFLDRLLEAQVERWTDRMAPGDASPFSVDSTVTIATAEAQYRLRLNAEGQVCVPERGLVGRLDARSRRRLLD